MNIKEFIKDLDPVTIIEFKNYIIEHLSDLCSTKSSNSKIISKFKDKEIFCEKCGCKLHKNGKTKNGIQKYICRLRRVPPAKCRPRRCTWRFLPSRCRVPVQFLFL